MQYLEMSRNFYYTIQIAICLIFIFSFIFSLRTVREDLIPSYMKGFYWYSFVAALIGVSATVSIIFSPNSSHSIFRTINMISLIFHFVFLSLFIFRVTTGFKIIALKVSFYGGLVILLMGISWNIFNNTFSFSFGFANFLLFIYCIYYYYQLLSESPRIILFKEASFWIITGIFVCTGLSFAPIVFTDFLVVNLPKKETRYFDLVITISYGIMHLLFIKAYILCLTQTRRK